MILLCSAQVEAELPPFALERLHDWTVLRFDEEAHIDELLGRIDPAAELVVVLAWTLMLRELVFHTRSEVLHIRDEPLAFIEAVTAPGADLDGILASYSPGPPGTR